MRFNYEAYDKSGKRFRDAVDARDAAEGTELLRSKGLYVTQINAAADASAAPSGRRRKKARGSNRLKKLAVFTRQFQILNATGTPIVEVLRTLELQITDTGWRQVIADMRGRVEEGSSLSEAMSEHPEYFDAVYRSLVSAGEAAGKLTSILEQLASLTRKQFNVRNNVVGALMYPAVLTVIAVSVLLLLLTAVVPRFAEMFEMMDAPLPATTRLIIGLGETMQSYWWAFLLVCAAMVGSGVMWLKTEGGRVARDTAALRAPMVGKLVQNIVTARIARFLGILMDSHLPLLESLALLRQSTANIHYQNLITKAEQAVVNGEPVSKGFNDHTLINPAMYQAMRSGEASGRVAPSLIQIADFMDEENEVVVRSLGSIVEPVILVALGVIVGLVALSMFTPMFDLTAASGAP